ncbi:MAG: ABA4-like family protein [Melioribacteraceae bacterium]|nr:ABA4-like family protein [Melioribacteraceae bacterium]
MSLKGYLQLQSIIILSKMDAESIFSFSSTLAMVGWAVLIVAPNWKYTRPIIQAGLIPLLLGIIYLFLIIQYFGEAEGGFGSLTDVKSLFENDYLLLAGWIHYLAFDLWIGHWEAGDAKKYNIHRLLLIPCQFLTFFFGPIGLLLYILVRNIKTRKISHENF